MSSRFFILSATCLSLAACSDFAGSTGTNPNNERANVGALVGGLVGAIVANDSGERGGAATVAGAGIGAAIGGVIGAKLDQQAADLEREIGNSDVTIRNTGESLVVTLPQDILFASDSATLRSDLSSEIAALARNLQAYPDTEVQIFGHTDSTASAQYNLDLSARRAGSVAAVLFNNGVATSRVRAIGRGEEAPVATNLTEEGKAQNRRVEIVIVPTA